MSSTIHSTGSSSRDRHRQIPDPVTGMLHGLVCRPAGQEGHGPFPVQSRRAHQPVMEAQEVQALTADLAGARFGSWPASVPARARPAGWSAAPARPSACSRDRHITIASSAYRTSTPCSLRPMPDRAGAGRRCRATGLTTPPCGVPVTGRRTCPSCITPARKIARSSFRTDWSQTRSCDRSHQLVDAESPRSSWRYPSRPPTGGPARTHQRAPAGRRAPSASGGTRTSTASMSASKTGSSTIFNAACTIRSRTEGIDSGRNSSFDPGLGDQHPRAPATADTVPPSAQPASSSRSRVTPYSSTSAKVVLSMPGAPSLRAHRDPRRATGRLCERPCPISAWNRRPGSALAAR